MGRLRGLVEALLQASALAKATNNTFMAGQLAMLQVLLMGSIRLVSSAF